MIISMATGYTTTPSMDFMQTVQVVFMLLFITGAIISALKQHRLYKKHDKPRLGTMLNRLGLAIVAFSILLNITVAPTVSLFLSDRLGMPYVLPSGLASMVFVGGVFFMLAGILISRVTRPAKVIVDEESDEATSTSTMETDLVDHR